MSFTRTLRYLLEALLLLVLILLFRLLPLDIASALGGWLARMLGPLFRAHRVAEKNLSKVLPEYNAKQRSKILSGMWDNLGRVMAEYPHLSTRKMRSRINVEGAEYLKAAREGGQSTVFFSGHFANWEVAPMVGVMFRLPVTFLYREANNPFANKLIQWMRGDYSHQMSGKGRESAQKLIQAMQKKQCIAMLVDQKLNEGVALPFMGFPAMTAVAVAKMAVKFKVPLCGIKIVRTHGVHFHATALPPVTLAPGATAEQAMLQIHAIVEDWVREHPEQWFWVHNRWDWRKIEGVSAKY